MIHNDKMVVKSAANDIMKLSIIIPTYNRVKDLDECLDSIIIQTTLPREMIIVDDSVNDEVKNLIAKRKNEFEGKCIFLKYIRNEKEKSASVARNIGIKYAIGDIILFLDSDVILDTNYIKAILKVFEENPHAMGVQGLIQNIKTCKKLKYLYFLFNRLFYLGFDEKDRCRVLPSLYSTYPCSLNKNINCEWLSGSNQSYRRSVLQEFKFDENLKKYSYGEDLDISYRVFKKYPHTLFMAPYAKLLHKESPEGRHLKREVIYTEVIYLTYLFYKNMGQNFKNKLIFIWSRIGRMIVNAKSLISKPEIKYVIKAPFYCLQHLEEIKKGDLQFFNRTLR